MDKLVVTRHKALYEYLVKHEYIEKGTPCLSHADVADVREKHVYGVLPYWLASKCGMYTEIQMRIPLDKRGKELSIDDVEFLSLRPRTYKVVELKDLGQAQRVVNSRRRK